MNVEKRSLEILTPFPPQELIAKVSECLKTGLFEFSNIKFQG